MESIALNRSLTGGQDFDELPGDDGLTVVIEPLSDSGRILPRPGKVTVVALDPSQQGEAARVAKWTVERKRVESSLRGGPGRGGIYLKLGWPRRKPQHRRLHVFVRYETDDGRRLEADQEIEIAMAGELARRWTPRTRSRPAAQVARTPSAARQSDAEREGNASRPPAAASPSPPPEAPAWSPYR